MQLAFGVQGGCMFDFNQQSYKDLRSQVAQRATPLVIWLGAGASASEPACLPSWKDLRTKIVAAIRSEAGSLVTEDRKKRLAELDVAAEHDDLWVAFEMLDRISGATFGEVVRGELGKGSTCDVPPRYLGIWGLRPSGILTLNLDRLAARAHSLHNAGESLDEFPGFEAGLYTHVLKSPTPWICGLHGMLANRPSWVFTAKSLRALSSNEKCTSFVRSVFSTRTVLFIGIAADDDAVEQHLENVGKIDWGNHFWLTDRSDAKTDGWAQQRGIRLVRYSSENNHADLGTVLLDLRGSIEVDSTDEAAAPVVVMSTPSQAADENLPAPVDLEPLGAERIRQALNDYVRRMLASGDHDAYRKYEEFAKKYRTAIWRAWEIWPEPPNNMLLGFEIARQIGSGGFGKVYEARRDRETFAIKVLHQHLNDQAGKLQSFRRGVRANRLLSEKQVEGIVQTKDASEIPAMVVMEYIDGPDLQEFVRSKRLADWTLLLATSLRLAQIIREAHKSQVYHRDLRPANVMIRGIDETTGALDLVVLDFDLAWHVDALEDSIRPDSANGYVAPELLERPKNVSTRASAVDAFGFGMTLFFMATRQAPELMEHRKARWKDTIEGRFVGLGKCGWRSLPTRIARLIANATEDVQAKRWDLSQIEGELEQLLAASVGRLRVLSPELLVEELARHVRNDDGYDWHSDSRTATWTFSGSSVRLRTESDRRVALDINWTFGGQSNWKGLLKQLPESGKKMEQLMKAQGWNASYRASGQVLTFEAICSVDRIVHDIEGSARKIDQAMRALPRADW